MVFVLLGVWRKNLSMLNIGIKDWINYNPNVGVEALHHIGLPGTGKSNMSTGLAQKCLQRGELLVMPGDRFCEWRHFPFHPKFPTKIKILIPKGIELFYYNFKRNGWFHEVDFSEINIFDHLDKDHKLLVIYDQHLPLSDRAKLWTLFAEQLLNRDVFLETAIGLLFHEAGIYFPEFASGDQWRATKKFSELFVEFRKGLVRTQLVSQLDTEIESTIRKKCMYACIRKTRLSRSGGWPKALVKRAPFTAINEFHWVYGGLYNRNNTITKFFENKKIFKIIPRLSMNGVPKGTPPEKFRQRKKFVCSKCNYEWIANVDKPKYCPNPKCKSWLEL